jgi:hypothetical protein
MCHAYRTRQRRAASSAGLVEEEPILTSSLDPTARPAARRLMREGLAEDPNRHLRLRASALYSRLPRSPR